MQAEATDSSLREGIEALGVKDTDKSAATVKEDENTEQRDAEMADATEEDLEAKDATSNYTHVNNNKKGKKKSTAEKGNKKKIVKTNEKNFVELKFLLSRITTVSIEVATEFYGISCPIFHINLPLYIFIQLCFLLRWRHE